MAIQYSTSIRNGQLDQVESVTGTSANLYIRTGAAPADCATADSGSLLATIVLPSDWMAAAASGSKAKSGTCVLVVLSGAVTQAAQSLSSTASAVMVEYIANSLPSRATVLTLTERDTTNEIPTRVSEFMLSR